MLEQELKAAKQLVGKQQSTLASLPSKESYDKLKKQVRRLAA